MFKHHLNGNIRLKFYYLMKADFNILNINWITGLKMFAKACSDCHTVVLNNSIAKYFVNRTNAGKWQNKHGPEYRWDYKLPYIIKLNGFFNL